MRAIPPPRCSAGEEWPREPLELLPTIETVATVRSYARRATARGRAGAGAPSREPRRALSGERCLRKRRTGPTGRADVFCPLWAGCDPLRRQQQRRASPAVQDWLDLSL